MCWSGWNNPGWTQWTALPDRIASQPRWSQSYWHLVADDETYTGRLCRLHNLISESAESVSSVGSCRRTECRQCTGATVLLVSPVNQQRPQYMIWSSEEAKDVCLAVWMNVRVWSVRCSDATKYSIRVVESMENWSANTDRSIGWSTVSEAHWGPVTPVETLYHCQQCGQGRFGQKLWLFQSIGRVCMQTVWLAKNWR